MKYKYNFKQRHKTIQGLRSFKDALPTKIKRIVVKKGDVYSKTLDNWKYLVGESLFKGCYPKAFKKSLNRGKLLLIMVNRGFEVELEYSKKEIIDKINYFFGYQVVDKILIKSFEESTETVRPKIKIDYMKKDKYTKKILKIKNEKLRNSLIELSKVFNKK